MCGTTDTMYSLPILLGQLLHSQATVHCLGPPSRVVVESGQELRLPLPASSGSWALNDCTARIPTLPSHQNSWLPLSGTSIVQWAYFGGEVRDVPSVCKLRHHSPNLYLSSQC